MTYFATAKTEMTVNAVNGPWTVKVGDTFQMQSDYSDSGMRWTKNGVVVPNGVMDDGKVFPWESWTVETKRYSTTVETVEGSEFVKQWVWN